MKEKQIIAKQKELIRVLSWYVADMAYEDLVSRNNIESELSALESEQQTEEEYLREELIKFVLNEVDKDYDEDPIMKHTREEAKNWIDEYLKTRKDEK